MSDKTLDELRDRICQMCTGEDGTEYSENCRRAGSDHDCWVQATIDTLVQREKCTECGGSGERFSEDCHTCHGTGTEPTPRKADVCPVHGITSESPIERVKDAVYDGCMTCATDAVHAAQERKADVNALIEAAYEHRRICAKSSQTTCEYCSSHRDEGCDFHAALAALGGDE